MIPAFYRQPSPRGHPLPPRALPHTNYQVRWQRHGWQRPHTRNYETQAGARHFVERKLLGANQPQYEPFIFIEIHRRPVGHWERHELVV